MFNRTIILAGIFIFLSLTSSLSFAGEQITEGEFYSERYILILKSTQDYIDAVCFAINAAKKLNLEFDKEHVRYSKEKGIYFEGIEDEDYNDGYYPRRYAGESISLENSGGYEGFADGFIIVVGGIYDDEASSARTLKNVKRFYNDAYVKKANMWMGCIH